MPFELAALFYSVLILIALIFIQVLMLPGNQGLGWGLGARDEEKPLGKLQGRVVRATRNHTEALVMFAPLVLIAHAMHLSNGTTVIGAGLFLAARAVYPVLYMLGVPVLRTLSYVASLVGILLIVAAFFGFAF